MFSSQFAFLLKSFLYLFGNPSCIFYDCLGAKTRYTTVRLIRYPLGFALVRFDFNGGDIVDVWCNDVGLVYSEGEVYGYAKLDNGFLMFGKDMKETHLTWGYNKTQGFPSSHTMSPYALHSSCKELIIQTINKL